MALTGGRLCCRKARSGSTRADKRRGGRLNGSSYVGHINFTDASRGGPRRDCDRHTPLLSVRLATRTPAALLSWESCVPRPRRLALRHRTPWDVACAGADPSLRVACTHGANSRLAGTAGPGSIGIPTVLSGASSVCRRSPRTAGASGAPRAAERVSAV